MAEFLDTISTGLTALGQGRSFASVQSERDKRKSDKKQQFLALDKQRQGALFQDAQAVNTFLKAGQTGKALTVISNRLGFFDKFGGDPSDSMEIKGLIESGDIKGAQRLLSSVETVGIQQGFLKDIAAERRKTEGSRTATQKDFTTFQELITKAEASGSDKDKRRAERFGRAARFIRETEQEKADIKVSQKEREAMARANVARKQGFINSGIEAANGAANVSRALSLLDELETGGFDNFALKARRLFGVEGADEGELSNLMGKAVLSQLKPIFGAAFTVRESDKLDALESGFGKSTANNKRLLENALKIIDRAARRGIAAAEDQGDKFTANEIREALSFNLADKLINTDSQAGQGATGNTSTSTDDELRARLGL